MVEIIICVVIGWLFRGYGFWVVIGLCVFIECEYMLLNW